MKRLLDAADVSPAEEAAFMILPPEMHAHILTFIDRDIDLQNAGLVSQALYMAVLRTGQDQYRAKLDSLATLLEAWNGLEKFPFDHATSMEGFLFSLHWNWNHMADWQETRALQEWRAAVNELVQASKSYHTEFKVRYAFYKATEKLAETLGPWRALAVFYQFQMGGRGLGLSFHSTMNALVLRFKFNLDVTFNVMIAATISDVYGGLGSLFYNMMIKSGTREETIAAMRAFLAANPDPERGGLYNQKIANVSVAILNAILSRLSL